MKAQRSNTTGVRLLYLFLSLATCCWFLYVFQRNLPDLGFHTIQPIVRGFGRTISGIAGRFGLDVLWAPCIWISAYIWGKKLLARIGLALETSIERLWLCTTAGLGVISMLAFALAAVRMFHRDEAYALVLLPIIFWFGETRRIVIAIYRRVQHRAGSQQFSARTAAHAFLTAYISVVLGIVFVSALGPELDYDPLVMHLFAAKAIAQEHMLKALPDVPQTFFPKNITMLFSVGLLLHSQILSRLLDFSFGLLVLLGAYCFATKHLSRTAGLLAAAILAATPLFVWEMRTAHLDCGSVLYISASLFATLTWLETRERPWFVAAVLLTAFSLGTKYQALFSLGSMTVIIVIYRFLQSRSTEAALRDSVYFFALSLLGMIPWGIVNWIQTRNPIFPFLNTVFHSPYWTADQTQRVLDEMHGSGIQITFANWWTIFTGFWDVTVDQIYRFRGNIGPFYMMFLPILFFHRRVHTAIKLVLGFSFCYWLFWLFTGQHLRYYLGALPGLAVAAAAAAVWFLENVRKNAGAAMAVAISVALAIAATLNTPLFESLGAGAHYGSPIASALPVKYLLGEESSDEYLSRNLIGYPIVEYLNSIKAHKNVFYWWNTAPLAFYLEHADVAFVYSRYFDEFARAAPARAYEILRQNGVTHIVIGEQDAQLQAVADPEKEFVHRYLNKLYQKNAEILYQVSSGAADPELVEYSFLNHIENAKFRSSSGIDGDNRDHRLVLEIGGDYRYALRMEPNSSVEYSVHVGEGATLRFATGRKFAPCNGDGVFQMGIRGETGPEQQIFRYEIPAFGQDDGSRWSEEHNLNLAAYAGRQVTFVFKTESANPGNCSWFLWADPQILSHSSIMSE